MKKFREIFTIAIMVSLVLTIVTACKKEEKKEESKTDYMVLVNKQSKLPDNWEEIVELANTKNAWDEDI